MKSKKQKETPWQVCNSSILEPNPPSNAFVVGEGDLLYAAVPFGLGRKLMIIHKGEQIKICNNEKSARNYINKHMRRR